MPPIAVELPQVLFGVPGTQIGARLTTPASAIVEVMVKRRALWSMAVSVMVLVGALPGVAGPMAATHSLSSFMNNNSESVSYWSS